MSNASAFMTAAAVAVCAGTIHAQPAFTWIGSFPNNQVAAPWGISPDGRYIAGYGVVQEGSPPTEHRAMRWDATTGVQVFGAVPGNWSDAYAISADGSTLVGRTKPSVFDRAARWNAAGVMTDMGTLPGGITSIAYGISADGTVIVGGGDSTAGTRGFRWTQATGMVPLDPSPGMDSSQASAISADGLTIGGLSSEVFTSTIHATLWVGGVAQDLGALPGDLVATVSWVSPDGSIVVGESRPTSNPATNRRAFRWTAATGMQPLFAIPDNTFIIGVSGDASIICFGAQLWTSNRGVVDVASLLTDVYGQDVTGQNSCAMTVTPDGRLLAGFVAHGVIGGFPGKGWLATLPTGYSCYANCDGSSAAPVLNINDFQCFINKFATGNSYANCDGSTQAPVLNVNDFQCFVNRFAAGCV